MNIVPGVPISDIVYFYHVYHEETKEMEKCYLKINYEKQEVKIEKINIEKKEI